MDSSFDVAVVGNGLFGAAAGRHLAERGSRVVVIGPDEPADPSTHAGVFASHYDQGRLTRRFDKRPTWAPATRRAIAGYRALEQTSGIDFYRPVGALIAGRAADLDTAADPRPTLADRGIEHRFYGPGDRGWQAEFDELDLPDDCYVVHELAPGGRINPRRMIAAQNRVAEAHGATIIRSLVTGIVGEAGSFNLQTDGGPQIAAARVLVAAGAFTNFHDLVPERLPLTIETETIALGRVAAQTAARLADYPTVTYDIDDPEIGDIYMVAPLRFPDGHHYIKIGANTTDDFFPTSLAEIQAWFHHGDSDRALPSFEAALRSLWPRTDFLGFETQRCILCRTPDGDPMIAQVAPGWFVATGGNGGGAKGSDAWGELAADLIDSVDN